MIDWTEGYVQELDYTHGYYRELAPGLLDLACTSRGISTLLEFRPLCYLELAFGQGMSVNIHAAACDGEFWGNDYNPTHAVNARDLAAASGANAQFSDDSFAEFAARDDLPEFDVIALHGTWSWISPENRRTILDIVRRRLVPGGVFYISYNCLPGWAAEVPLRHLLALHAELASPASLGLAARIDASMDFAHSLLDADARYFRAHDGLKATMEKLGAQTRNYLAHEYFNRDWHPMAFADVAKELDEAKLSFAATATLIEHVEGLGLTDRARSFLAEIRHPVMRETVHDYFTNQRFRRDIFVKGPRHLSKPARNERLRSIPFALLVHPDQVPLKAAYPGGEADLNPDVYRPFLEALAADGYTPKTLDTIESHPACGKLNFQQLLQAALMLTGTGSIHPAQRRSAIEDAEPRCDALNARILDLAALSSKGSALASPVIGAGVLVSRPEMLFLRALGAGMTHPEQWARHAWDCLYANDEHLVVGGRTIETAEQNQTHLSAEANEFGELRLPVLRSLGIA